MNALHPIFQQLADSLCPETSDDEISRLDLVRYLEAEIAATKSRVNPAGAFYHQDTARLSALRMVLEHVNEMEGV